jgi:hypothetical protein
MSRSESGLPPKLRGLPREQARLILERPACWEHLLFSEALLHEIVGLADLKRDWHYGIAPGATINMTPRAFSGWIQNRLEEARRFAVSVNQIMNQAFVQALGPEGEDGDPEAILYCAKRLADVYKGAMKWRLEFVKINIPDQLDKLKAATASLCDHIPPQIEEFASEINRELKQAIVDMEAGKSVSLHIRLELTTPGADGIDREVSRLNALIESGRLAWN